MHPEITTTRVTPQEREWLRRTFRFSRLVQSRKAYFWRKQYEAPSELCKFYMLEAFRAEVDRESVRWPADMRITFGLLIAVTLAAIAITIHFILSL